MTNGNKDAEWLSGMEEFDPGKRHPFMSKVHTDWKYVVCLVAFRLKVRTRPEVHATSEVQIGVATTIPICFAWYFDAIIFFASVSQICWSLSTSKILQPRHIHLSRFARQAAAPR